MIEIKIRNNNELNLWYTRWNLVILLNIGQRDNSMQYISENLEEMEDKSRNFRSPEQCGKKIFREILLNKTYWKSLQSY